MNVVVGQCAHGAPGLPVPANHIQRERRERRPKKTAPIVQLFFFGDSAQDRAAHRDDSRIDLVRIRRRVRPGPSGITEHMKVVQGDRLDEVDGLLKIAVRLAGKPDHDIGAEAEPVD